MIVVSDTSPLNYLILISAIDILPRLFGEIHVPAEVLNELQRSRAPEVVKRWAQSPPQWLRVSTPATAITASVRLDSGEAHAIALAKELGADAVLIDERKVAAWPKNTGCRRSAPWRCSNSRLSGEC